MAQIVLDEGAAQSTPSAGKVTLYAKTDGLLYAKDDAGTEYGLSMSIGTGVATFLATPSSANLASAVTDETGSGALVFGTSPTLTTPTINGYIEDTHSANTGTAYTIDLANGTIQILTLTGNCTYTFPANTAGTSFLLIQKQDATGSRTVTWDADVKWPSSTAPTITATASKADVFAFACDGTYWYGVTVGQNYL